MLEIKSIVTKIKDIFDGLIGRVNTAEKKISELEDMSMETPQMKCNKEKSEEKNSEYPTLWDIFKM